MRTFLFIPALVFFMSCCATQFFIIENENKQGVTKDGRQWLSQTIVIANPPKNINKLIEIVDAYNRRSISFEDILDHDVFRIFYKETGSLTRNFAVGDPYPRFSYGWWVFDSYDGQQWGNHYYTRDNLLHTSCYYNNRLSVYFRTSAKKITSIEGNDEISVRRWGANGEISFSRIIDEPEKYFIKE
jgi:hypothetical protein